VEKKIQGRQGLQRGAEQVEGGRGGGKGGVASLLPLSPLIVKLTEVRKL
jgi:uncharacterized spore protein YtfJ